MAKVGDIVRFLNDVGGGRIARIDGQYAFVEDSDGFEQPVLLKECVIVDADQPKKTKSSDPQQSKTTIVEPVVTSAATVTAEKPEGDKLNIVFAFEPADIKQLSTTTFDAVLVNDSNYFLYAIFSTSDESHLWTTRYAGIIEPNFQVSLGEIEREAIPHLDRISIQYVAFKRDSAYRLKAPFAVEHRVDNTKFHRLHCFHTNPYFDTPVIAFDITKDDRPVRPVMLDRSQLQDAMNEKRYEQDDDKKRPLSKPNQQRGEVIEVDLHINQLVDTVSGLSHFDMLQCQLKEFRRVMAENIDHRGRRIVFIHGKGEGVLRQEIIKELHRHYPRCYYQDASFRQYGFGATQVTIG